MTVEINGENMQTKTEGIILFRCIKSNQKIYLKIVLLFNPNNNKLITF